MGPSVTDWLSLAGWVGETVLTGKPQQAGYGQCGYHCRHQAWRHRLLGIKLSGISNTDKGCCVLGRIPASLGPCKGHRRQLGYHDLTSSPPPRALLQQGGSCVIQPFTKRNIRNLFCSFKKYLLSKYVLSAYDTPGAVPGPGTQSRANRAQSLPSWCGRAGRGRARTVNARVRTVTVKQCLLFLCRTVTGLYDQM